MPKTNLAAFILITAALIAGWWWVKFSLMDQPDKDAKDGKDGAAVVLKDTKKDDGPPNEGKDKDATPPKVDTKEPDKQPPVADVPVVAEKPAANIQFPDPSAARYAEYFIRATVTTRGAGIRNLTLTKFQKADENGQPVFNSDGTKTLLQLIEDDPIVASFLMYHYRNPEPDDADTFRPWPCDTTLGQMIWERRPDLETNNAEQSELVLASAKIPGYDELVIIKRYTLKPQQYHIGLTLEIHDQRKASTKAPARQFRYQLAGSHGLPVEGQWYTSVYRTPMIGILDERGRLVRDLDETQHRISVKGGGDRVPLAGLGTSMIQYAGVSTQYFTSLTVVDDKQYEPKDGGVDPRKVLAFCRPTLESQEIAGVIEDIDTKNSDRPTLKLRIKDPSLLAMRPWEFVLLPRAKDEVLRRELKKGDQIFVNYYNADNVAGERVATGVHIGNVPRPQLDDITVRVASNSLTLEPGTKIVHKLMLYHGPAKVRLLSQFGGDEEVKPEGLVDRYAETLHLATLTDYRSPGPFGKVASMIGWTEVLIWTTRFMHWLLYGLHKAVGWIGGGYGLSIMLLTLIVRGAMFPVSRRSALLSQRMQALGPEIKKVQEKYKNDPQAKTAAVMELYRKHGVNPFGSCLPMILQMPFFLGLYYCLQESINFRLAGFLWMDNLAAPDMLIHWGDGIPIISDPDNMAGSFFSFLYLGPYFNLLPVIAVALMLVQQKLMTPPPADEQQEMQQKMMKYMFVFIGIMFYKVAAGLCVYFIISSLWGLCERKMLPKKTLAVAGAPTPPASNGQPTGGAKLARTKGRPEKKEKKPETAMQKVKDWWDDLLKQAQKK